MSASGTPTAATAPQVTEARTVSKVRSVCATSRNYLSSASISIGACLRMCLYLHAPVRTHVFVCVHLEDFQEVVWEIKLDKERLP